ncbi:cholinesterase 1-like [Uloborus diversus]|uniref:cholinesterase 1-like n=1 Tax=Uloborus diversus TaxID=327109 RepID=UPI00240A213F|nr:cholinesterase 1-like [Uloborus diversus]
MVWVHSGFLQFGSGHEEGLRPSGGLASHLNVVFVSFNFRLHAFGYLALEALATGLEQDSRGNYGTWDQLLLMEWVQQNIHSFGGDPNKVTAFGPDGGAASILSLMGRNAPFRSAWLLGPALLSKRTFLDASQHSGSHFSEKSGCGPDTSCLRNLSPKEVISSYIWNDDPTFRIRDQNDLPIQGILPEQLMVVDGEILPFSPIEAALHKNIKDIPLLIGTSAQAVDFWPGPDDLHSWTWTQYRKYVTTSLDSFDPQANGLVRVSNYPGIYSSHLWEAVAFFNQLHRYIEFPSDEDFAFRDTVQRTVLEFVKTAGNQVKPEEWLTYPSSVALLNSNITLVTSYHKTKCKFWSSHGLTDYAWVS